MNRRPWPLVLLALAQILTPVANVFYNALALRVSPLQVVYWIFDQPALRVFEYVALMPLAGIAIYSMKRWSYLVFFAAVGWSASTHIRYHSTVSENYPWAAVFLAYALDVLLVLYFLLPRVRRTYLDPSVRWWEASPRYEISAPVRFTSGSREIAGTALNLSEGGAFVFFPSGQDDVASQGELRIDVFGRRFGARAQLIDRAKIAAPAGGTIDGYRVQFQHDAESEAEIGRLVAGLKRMGFQARGRHEGAWSEFKTWLSTLLKTGKGLVPDSRNSRRS